MFSLPNDFDVPQRSKTRDDLEDKDYKNLWLKSTIATSQTMTSQSNGSEYQWQMVYDHLPLQCPCQLLPWLLSVQKCLVINASCLTVITSLSSTPFISLALPCIITMIIS